MTYNDITYKHVLRGLPLSTYAESGRGGVGPNADVVNEVA